MSGDEIPKTSNASEQATQESSLEPWPRGSEAISLCAPEEEQITEPSIFITECLWYLQFALPEETQEPVFGLAWEMPHWGVHCIYITGR